MTMLYRLDADAAAITRALGAWGNDDPWAGGYVTPARFAPVITAGREFIAGPRPGRGQARLTPRLWGVPPPPGADDPARLICTVRNTQSPFWIGNLRNSEFRCLIPATSFMEWAAGMDVEGRRKQHRFTCSDQPVFAIAGVWKDSEVPGFAMLTCKANSLMRQAGKDRMPVILPASRAAQETWLHGGWAEAEKLLEPYASGMMRKVTG